MWHKDHVNEDSSNDAENAYIKIVNRYIYIYIYIYIYMI